MTLDMTPKRWRQMAGLFSLWLQLPSHQASHLITVLPESEQERFDAFLLSLKEPRKALKELENYANRGELDTVETLVKKLPKVELQKLVRFGLKKGKLIDNLSKLRVEELRDLLILCSYPKHFLVYFVFFLEGLDNARKKKLLS